MDLKVFFIRIYFCSLVGAIMGTPADVVKARMMNQPTNANGQGLLYKRSRVLFKVTGIQEFMCSSRSHINPHTPEAAPCV